VAPRATVEISEDLLGPLVIGREPDQATETYYFLYDLMRVRGYGGGFYHDALAAIDIAMWDAAGRIAGLPVSELVGGRKRDSIRAYVSGLPERELWQRTRLALDWHERGFDCVQLAAPLCDQGTAAEIASLREALGPKVNIACDMHWMPDSGEAIAAIRDMESCDLWFAEAPVLPEDVRGLGHVAGSVSTPIAVGEEWRTEHDARLRLDSCRIGMIQPEMGHTGITQFRRMAALAAERNVEVIPHATIGSGLFLAASLQLASAIEGIEMHEFQHSVFHRDVEMISGGIECASGCYRIGDEPGIGVTPTSDLEGRLFNL